MSHQDTSNPTTIITPIKKTYLLFVRVLNDSESLLIYLLHSSIWEHALLTAIREETFQGPVREVDLLRPVRKVLFNLLVLEFEYLKTVLKGGLGGSGVGEEVNCLLARVSLLDVFVCKPHDLVAIGPHLALDAICKDNLLFAV